MFGIWMGLYSPLFTQYFSNYCTFILLKVVFLFSSINKHSYLYLCSFRLSSPLPAPFVLFHWVKFPEVKFLSHTAWTFYGYWTINILQNCHPKSLNNFKMSTAVPTLPSVGLASISCLVCSSPQSHIPGRVLSKLHFMLE